MQAIKEIALQFDANTHVQKITDSKLSFYVYLDNLYSGHKWCAVKGFFSSIPYLLTGTALFWKEVIRFGGLQLLGVERFINLSKSKKSR
jgi:hypothetical protein